MNGKEQQYNLIICAEQGMPMNMFTRTDEDLIEKFLRCREDKFSYFQRMHTNEKFTWCYDSVKRIENFNRKGV